MAIPEHEEALIRAFIAPHRRERLLKLLATSKGRKKMLDQLHHFYDLDQRFAQEAPRSGKRGEQIDNIYRLLKEKGAPGTCYVMGSRELDGQTVSLRDALEEVIADSYGTFISCIPGKLGYYEGENENERYVLQR